MILLMLAALLPPFMLLRYIYRLDAIEKEPASFIRKLVIWGVLSVIPAIILEMGAGMLIGSLPVSEGVFLVLENFLGVALVEEGVKYWCLKKSSWNSREFNYRFDGIVYAVAVSIGIATIENVTYAVSEGLETALIRAVTSIPGHAIFGIYMGYYYGFARYCRNRGNERASRGYLLKSLWVPVVLHGLYDYILSVDREEMMIVFIIYLVVLNLFAWRSVKRYAAQDERI